MRAEDELRRGKVAADEVDVFQQPLRALLAEKHALLAHLRPDQFAEGGLLRPALARLMVADDGRAQRRHSSILI